MPVTFGELRKECFDGVLRVSGAAHVDIGHAMVTMMLRFFGDRCELESLFFNLGGGTVTRQVSSEIVASIPLGRGQDRSALSWQSDYDAPLELRQLAEKITQEVVTDSAEAIDEYLERAAVAFGELVDDEVGALSRRIDGYRSLQVASLVISAETRESDARSLELSK
jgi:hypothetical protein